MPKPVDDHPIEDIFGTEIKEGDAYWQFGEHVVNNINIQRYLIEIQQIACFRAQ